MDQNPSESYVNPSPEEVFQSIYTDPTFQHFLEIAVQERISKVERGYLDELAKRDHHWGLRETEYNMMAAEVESLTAQLTNAQVVDSSTRMVDDDPGMSNFDIPAPEPKGPSSRKAKKKAVAPAMPQPATSRTLRSSKHLNGGQAVGTSSSSPPTPRAPVEAVSPTTAKPRRAGELYRLLGSDLPADALGLKKSLILHIRILWGLFNSTHVPADPSDRELRLFNTQFSTHDGLRAVTSGPCLVPLDLVKVGLATSESAFATCQIAAQASKFGLTRWAPDLRQTPYSLYNAACRIIAIDTFKQAVVAHAYDHLGPNVAYLKDAQLLIKLYDHFIHYYQLRRYKKEAQNQGSVKAADEMNPAYKARSQLASSRRTFLVENRYPQRYIDLIDAKATSDDEADANGLKEGRRQIHWIRRRPERSQAAEVFVRRLDVTRERATRLTPGKQWRERLRRIPSIPRDSEFTSIPLGLPIDYFDPEFFNQLQPSLRSRATSRTISLLPDPSKSFGGHADEKLDDEKFMEKYEADVLAHYHLDDIVEWEDQDEDWLADDDENMADIEEEEEDASTVASERTSLIHRLSADNV